MERSSVSWVYLFCDVSLLGELFIAHGKINGRLEGRSTKENTSDMTCGDILSDHRNNILRRCIDVDDDVLEKYWGRQAVKCMAAQAEAFQRCLWRGEIPWPWLIMQSALRWWWDVQIANNMGCELWR